MSINKNVNNKLIAISLYIVIKSNYIFILISMNKIEIDSIMTKYTSRIFKQNSIK